MVFAPVFVSPVSRSLQYEGVCVDVAETDDQQLVCPPLCTVCRHKCESKKPDSVQRHQLLNVLLCKVYNNPSTTVLLCQQASLLTNLYLLPYK